MKQFFRITFGSLAVVACSAMLSAVYADVASRQQVKTIPHKSKDIVRSASSSVVAKENAAGKRLVRSAAESNQKEEIIIDEDFSLMTEGTVDSPDETHLIDIENYDIYIPDKYTHQPGWSGTGVFQAGGAAALNYPDYGGYINTPEGNYAGQLHITCRVKPLPHNESKYPSINIGVCSGGVNSSAPRTLAYCIKDVENGDEWTELAWDTMINDPSMDQFVQFNTYDYLVIEDIKVTVMLTSLPAPQLKEATEHTIDGFTANWSPVARADYYLLSVFHNEPIGSDTDIVSYSESFEGVNADGTDLDWDDMGLPEGWEFNPDDYDQVYIDEESVADGKYSLRISSDYDLVQMPNNGGLYVSLTLKARAVSAEGTEGLDFPGKIYVYGWDGYKWVNPRGTYFFLPDYNWHELDLTSVIKGKYYAVKLVFKDFENCEMALDDFHWTTTPPAEKMFDLENIKVTNTSYAISGLDPEKDYYFTVSAGSEALGIDSGEVKDAMSAFGVAAPTTKEAVNIDADKYTAQWNGVPKATGYQVYNYGIFTASEDIQDFEVLSDSFDYLEDMELTGLHNLDLIPLDDYVDRLGWYGYMTILGLGGIGATNNPDFGIGGQIQSPELSLGNDNGHYKVEIELFGEPDDEIIVVNSAGEKHAIYIEEDEAAETLFFEQGQEGDILTFYSDNSLNFLITNIRVLQNLKSGDKVATMVDYAYTTGLDHEFNLFGAEQEYAFDVQAVYENYFDTAWSDRSDRRYVLIPTVVDEIDSDFHAEMPVDIYTLSGIYVGSLKSGNCVSSLTLPTGIYVMKCGEKTKKIVLK